MWRGLKGGMFESKFTAIVDELETSCVRPWIPKMFVKLTKCPQIHTLPSARSDGWEQIDEPATWSEHGIDMLPSLVRSKLEVYGGRSYSISTRKEHTTCPFGLHNHHIIPWNCHSIHDKLFLQEKVHEKTSERGAGLYSIRGAEFHVTVWEYHGSDKVRCTWEHTSSISWHWRTHYCGPKKEWEGPMLANDKSRKKKPLPMSISEPHGSQLAPRWEMLLNAWVRNISCRHHSTGNPWVIWGRAQCKWAIDWRVFCASIWCQWRWNPRHRRWSAWPWDPRAHSLGVWHLLEPSVRMPCTRPVKDSNNPAWFREFTIPSWHFTRWASGSACPQNEEIWSWWIVVTRYQIRRYKRWHFHAMQGAWVRYRLGESLWKWSSWVADQLGSVWQYHRECMKYELYDIVPRNWSFQSCKASKSLTIIENMRSWCRVCRRIKQVMYITIYGRRPNSTKKSS